MSTNDQRAARSGRTRSVSVAVARRSPRLRLVRECLRSHDRFAERDLGVDQGASS